MDAIKRFASGMRLMKPPALTTGLLPFILILNAIQALESLDLTPSAIEDININRLSFYSLVFWDWKQLLWQYALFAPLLGQYELRNGTVRAGILLNISTFLPGVVCNLIALVTRHRVMGNVFYGLSSLMLVFSAILSVNIWVIPRLTLKGHVITVPSFTVVLIPFTVCVILKPHFWFIYVLALLFGLGIGLNYLQFLIEPTTRVVAWIEEKLAPGIDFLRKIVTFVGEVDARELRERNFHAWKPTVQYATPASLTQP